MFLMIAYYSSASNISSYCFFHRSKEGVGLAAEKLFNYNVFIMFQQNMKILNQRKGMLTCKKRKHPNGETCVESSLSEVHKQCTSPKNHQSYQRVICSELAILNRNYKRYVNRVDQLKTNKQKLLAICRLRRLLNKQQWAQCKKRLTSYLTDRQFQNLQHTRLGRRYSFTHHIMAIWNIDKQNFKKLTQSFNQFSSKQLTLQDFLPYLKNAQKPI